MAIAVNCPNCRALFRLAEEMAGKKVRCQKCQHVFTVARPEDPPPFVLTPFEAPKSNPDVQIDETAAIATAPPPKAAPVPMPPPPPVVDEAPDEDQDEPARKKNSKPPPVGKKSESSKSSNRPRRERPESSSSWMMPMLMILLVCGSLVACVGCAGVGAYFTFSGNQDAPKPGPGPIAFNDKKDDRPKQDGGPKQDGQPKQDAGQKDFNPPPPPPPIKKTKGPKGIAPGGQTLVFGADGVARVDSNLSPFDPQNQFGRRHKVFFVTLEAGQKVWFDMMSDQIDSYLYVLDDTNMLLAQDDGGEGLNSRLWIVAPRAGTYRIQCSCFGGNDSGRFTLIVRREAGPKLP